MARTRKKTRKARGTDRRMWKMSPERLEEHLKLRNRATQIPDKKKEQSKKACRNTRRAFPLSSPCRERSFPARAR